MKLCDNRVLRKIESDYTDNCTQRRSLICILSKYYWD
jgi:hypothetical protein